MSTPGFEPALFGDLATKKSHALSHTYHSNPTRRDRPHETGFPLKFGRFRHHKTTPTACCYLIIPRSWVRSPPALPSALDPIHWTPPNPDDRTRTARIAPKAAPSTINATRKGGWILIRCRKGVTGPSGVWNSAQICVRRTAAQRAQCLARQRRRLSTSSLSRCDADRASPPASCRGCARDSRPDGGWCWRARTRRVARP